MISPTLRLSRLLGQGGMGSVWLADHLALQTQVAVKFLSQEMAASPEAIERFKREATAAAQIRSPHVVQTLDHGITADGVPYIVLELLEGEELGARMEREPRLPVALVALVVSQVCKALAKAHSLNIVHRDIKPDNIFLVDVDGEPFVKVLDFGIAKKTGESSLKMTSTNAMIGTPYYMSPEQAFSSKDVDARTDLWALAVVAYYALVGDVPFSGETVGAICLAIDKAQYTPVTQLRPELPPALDAWFARAFARKLDKRFASAREMADAFQAAIGDEVSAPMSAAWASRRPSALPPAPTRSRWMLPALLAGVLLALGGGLALGLSRPSKVAATPAPSASLTSTEPPAVAPSAPEPSATAAPSPSPPLSAAEQPPSLPGTPPSKPGVPRTNPPPPPKKTNSLSPPPPVTTRESPPAPPPPVTTSKDRGF